MANLPEIQTPIPAFARTDKYRAKSRCLSKLSENKTCLHSFCHRPARTDSNGRIWDAKNRQRNLAVPDILIP